MDKYSKCYLEECSVGQDDVAGEGLPSISKALPDAFRASKKLEVRGFRGADLTHLL